MATGPPRVFLSYSREDSDFASRLATSLGSLGIDVWIDKRDIRPGLEWDSAVEKALKDCSRVLVILSPSSAASTHVRNEVSVAIAKGKAVIPVLYLDCEIPMSLHRLQYIDFRTGYEGSLRELAKALGSEKRTTSASRLQPAHPIEEGPNHPRFRRRIPWLAIVSAALLVVAAVPISIYRYRPEHEAPPSGVSETPAGTIATGSKANPPAGPPIRHPREPKSTPQREYDVVISHDSKLKNARFEIDGRPAVVVSGPEPGFTTLRVLPGSHVLSTMVEGRNCSMNLSVPPDFPVAFPCVAGFQEAHD